MTPGMTPGMTMGEMIAFLSLAVTAVPLAVGGVVGFILKVSDRQTEREDKAAAKKQADQDKVEERLAKLEQSDRDKTVKIQKLEDKTRDQGELINDAEPLVGWIHNGARPPIPVVGWRWLRHLTERHHDETTQDPPTAGPLS